jgi:hypothetical protein
LTIIIIYISKRIPERRKVWGGGLGFWEGWGGCVVVVGCCRRGWGRVVGVWVVVTVIGDGVLGRGGCGRLVEKGKKPSKSR